MLARYFGLSLRSPTFWQLRLHVGLRKASARPTKSGLRIASRIGIPVARVEQVLQAASHRRSDRWIWVYHAPPKGALSWTGKRHYGDAVLAELVKRYSPTAVLCGHIHEAPFKTGGSWNDRIGETWLFNAGRQIGDVPARIEIDFTQHEARWISLAGIEEKALQ